MLENERLLVAPDPLDEWSTFGEQTQSENYAGLHIPLRLQGSFADRPWPTHDLGDRIIDTYYTPLTIPNTAGPHRILEIIDDNHYRVNSSNHHLKYDSYRMRFMNVLLLTRGFAIRLDEFVALSGVTAKQYSTIATRFARTNLINTVGNTVLDVMALEADGPLGATNAHRRVAQLKPEVVIFDRRAEKLVDSV